VFVHFATTAALQAGKVALRPFVVRVNFKYALKRGDGLLVVVTGASHRA
jgi:hypothetical protein